MRESWEINNKFQMNIIYLKKYQKCMWLRKNVFLILLLLGDFLTITSYEDVNFLSYLEIMTLAEEREEDVFRQLEVVNYAQKLCISLGFNCHLARNFEINNLRQWSLPFDWNLTSIDGLCAVIENDFEDFLNPMYLSVRSDCLGLYNSKYNLSFAHDFPQKENVNEYNIRPTADNYLDFLEKIRSKYYRRIERFYNLSNLADTIYFFRLKAASWTFSPIAEESQHNIEQDKENIIKLRNVLRKKFPKDNWILVAIDVAQEYEKDWEIPQVKNFCLGGYSSDKVWIEIFKKLNLICE